MSIFEYNGSALVAMVGKNCFAIASDRRLGVQPQTTATDFQRISKIHDKLFIGLSASPPTPRPSTSASFSATNCISSAKRGT